MVQHKGKWSSDHTQTQSVSFNIQSRGHSKANVLIQSSASNQWLDRKTITKFKAMASDVTKLAHLKLFAFVFVFNYSALYAGLPNLFFSCSPSLTWLHQGVKLWAY